jgi:outer membrane protein
MLAGALALGAVVLPVQAENKVGFVNTVQLMEEAPQAKSAQTKLEKEFAPREQELLNLQKEIRALEDRLARDSAVMSETETSKLEREILAKRRDLKRTQDEFRDDLNIRKNEVLSKLQRQMYDATVALAKEKKFDIILGQGVVYSSDKVDITERVLEKLKKEFKASGAK